jgi:hypothetical protein
MISVKRKSMEPKLDIKIPHGVTEDDASGLPAVRPVRRGDHLLQCHLRMAVALVTRRFFAELDRLLRAPLDAGEALFAVMKPDGFAGRKIDVPAGADGPADAAGVAFLIYPEPLVHRRDAGKGEPVEPREQDVLPQRTLLDRPLLPCGNNGGDPADLFPRRRA